MNGKPKSAKRSSTPTMWPVVLAGIMVVVSSVSLVPHAQAQGGDAGEIAYASKIPSEGGFFDELRERILPVAVV